MALMRRCDRCGLEEPLICDLGWVVFTIPPNVDGGPSNRRSWDLCPECRELMAAWIDTPTREGR